MLCLNVTRKTPTSRHQTYRSCYSLTISTTTGAVLVPFVCSALKRLEFRGIDHRSVYSLLFHPQPAKVKPMKLTNLLSTQGLCITMHPKKTLKQSNKFSSYMQIIPRNVQWHYTVKHFLQASHYAFHGIKQERQSCYSQHSNIVLYIFELFINSVPVYVIMNKHANEKKSNNITLATDGSRLILFANAR